MLHVQPTVSSYNTCPRRNFYMGYRVSTTLATSTDELNNSKWSLATTKVSE